MVETKLSINVKIKNTLKQNYCERFLIYPKYVQLTDYFKTTKVDKNSQGLVLNFSWTQETKNFNQSTKNSS